MDRMLYIGMSGAKETMLAQGINGNNLANVSTTGFREDLEQFRSMPVFGPGHPSRAFAMTERPGHNFAAGPLNTTGRDLDLAIEDQGWFTVTAADGNEAYTRAGDMRLTPEGFLVTGNGLQVMGDNGPIAIPAAESINIGADGTISVRPVGQDAAALVTVDRLRLVKPPLDQMEKGRDGLFRLKGGEIADADFTVRVRSGVLEQSNVSVVDAMVEMVNLQRRYELQVKSMKTAEENDQATDALMRVS